MKNIHLLLLTFLALPLYSWIEPLPGEFALQGEFLYFAASYDETYFAINGAGLDGEGNPTPNGKRVNNPIGYHPGFRLEGAYAFCNSCVDVRLRWTHLYARETQSVSNFSSPEIWPTEEIPSLPGLVQPFVGEARSSIGVMYQKGEVIVDEALWHSPWCRAILREAVEWSYIRYHESILYNAIALQERIQFHGHTKGLGPQLGIIFLTTPPFCFWPSHLSFKAMTTASLIAANSKAKVMIQDPLSGENKVTQSSFWKFMPEWMFSFGFNYDARICNCLISSEIGYEFTTYVRGTSKLVFDEGANPGHSFNNYSDFYVHGLYATLGITF